MEKAKKLPNNAAIAILLLILQFIIGLIVLVVSHFQKFTSIYPLQITIPLYFCLIFAIISNIKKRGCLGRILLVAFTILSLFFSYSDTSGYTSDLALNIMNSVCDVLNIAAIVYLYTPSSSEWFREVDYN